MSMLIGFATAQVISECRGKDVQYYVANGLQFGTKGVNVAVVVNDSIVSPVFKNEFIDGTYIFYKTVLQEDKEKVEEQIRREIRKMNLMGFW